MQLLHSGHVQKKNSKINYKNRKAIFHVSHAPEAAIRLPPKIGNKNILNSRVSNRRFNIKKLLLQFKKMQVKQRRRVIRERDVRRKALYPSGKCRVEYKTTSILIYFCFCSEGCK